MRRLLTRFALGLLMAMSPVTTVTASPLSGPLSCAEGQIITTGQARFGRSISLHLLGETGLKSPAGKPLCLAWAEERYRFGLDVWPISSGHAVLDPASGAFAPLVADDSLSIRQMLGLLPMTLPSPTKGLFDQLAARAMPLLLALALLGGYAIILRRKRAHLAGI